MATYQNDILRGILEADRNKYIKLFNRLDAAVGKHMDTKTKDGFTDEADDELYAAYKRVLRDAGPGSNPLC